MQNLLVNYNHSYDWLGLAHKILKYFSMKESTAQKFYGVGTIDFQVL